MSSYKDRRFWILTGFGIFVIVVLFVSLLFLIFSEKNLPDNAVVVDSSIIRGEELNEEIIQKLNKLFEENPGLKNLPMNVEYFSEDLSEYSKYILSYELDDSERGFRLIMKDYTGEGEKTGIEKFSQMEINLDGIEIKYEDLSDETLNFKADVI